MAHVASSHKGGAPARSKELAPVRPVRSQKIKADFKIDEQLSSNVVLLAASASFLFASLLPPCSLLLPPPVLSSLPCLFSFLHAQMDGSRSLTRCSTLGRRVSFLCLSLCLSSLLVFLHSLCLVISAVLLTNRQMICLSLCANSFYIWFLILFYLSLFVHCSLMCYFFCSFVQPIAILAHSFTPFTPLLLFSNIIKIFQFVSITLKRQFCVCFFFTGGGLILESMHLRL